ncbi:MAG: DUF2283 domain-containing protein [Methanosarcinales archaeon]|jgi:hypothetical protein|nr:DUF2283 domain-containing protein [Methanosarcinales archaeon]
MEWDYDSEADVLYISFGAPRPAVGVDMGNGVIMRYDEKHGRDRGHYYYRGAGIGKVSERAHQPYRRDRNHQSCPGSSDRNYLTKIP